MVFKLKTSKETMAIFESLGINIHLQPFALCKLSIALSLHSETPLGDSDFKTNNDGLELNRQTITGEYDDLFKALIISKEGRSLSDEEYFPKHLKAYIDKGAKMLDSEFKYSNNEFYKHLVQIDKGV
jgi:DNA sulfur modification protein DndE